jgi:aryl-alcohol dehydrogenase-like predicted oxidoreductase
MGGAVDRRVFLASSLAAGAAMALPAPLAAWAQGRATAPPEWRNRQAGMKYRRLGRTGFMISEIVCGGDPIAPDNRRHVEMAVERGLNYLDTAPDYGGKSEEGYAEVLRAVGRDKVFQTTKVGRLGPSRNRAYLAVFEQLGRADQEAVLKEVAADLQKRGAALPDYMGNYFGGQLREIETDALSDVLERRYRLKIDARATYGDVMVKSVEESLTRLKTDYVDVLMCPHGASSYAETQIPEVHETFEKLKQQGKVRAPAARRTTTLPESSTARSPAASTRWR